MPSACPVEISVSSFGRARRRRHIRAGSIILERKRLALEAVTAARNESVCCIKNGDITHMCSIEHSGTMKRAGNEASRVMAWAVASIQNDDLEVT